MILPLVFFIRNKMGPFIPNYKKLYQFLKTLNEQFPCILLFIERRKIII